MHVTIERGGCISCGLCEGTCPSVFRIAEDGVCVQAGEVNVTYTYRPSVKAREDEAELDRKGDARLMALGTACEFSLMNGMFDAASLLDKRYRDALACACRDRSGRMKMRSWI